MEEGGVQTTSRNSPKTICKKKRENSRTNGGRAKKKLEIINIDYIKESEGAYRAESEALIINNIPMIQLEMNKTKKNII